MQRVCKWVLFRIWWFLWKIIRSSSLPSLQLNRECQMLIVSKSVFCELTQWNLSTSFSSKLQALLQRQRYLRDLQWLVNNCLYYYIFLLTILFLVKQVYTRRWEQRLYQINYSKLRPSLIEDNWLPKWNHEHNLFEMHP